MITDLQSGKTAIIGPDDLNEEGYLEHVYKISEEEAEELRSSFSRSWALSISRIFEASGGENGKRPPAALNQAA